ncbi:MAG: MazG nucleotide pyrophosphohydrolase [uncultured bacterium]|nr:MAG: MazG nucleotide pyrophosphohydrolase [uncultured bacterium]
MNDIIDVNQLKKLQQEFSDMRDWNKFHTPKNLAMALTCESAELLEIFQWLTEEEAHLAHTDAKIKHKTSQELADIMLYLIRLADLMHINLNEAIHQKLLDNHKKYPAELVKGSAKKYDEYFTD